MFASCTQPSGTTVAPPWYPAVSQPAGILKGLRIVTYSTVLAAPAATAILSDLGAEVIKIEDPKGDPLRALFHKAERSRASKGIGCTIFEVMNRGAKSVTLNLKDPEKQQELKDLLHSADVFVTNGRIPLLKEFTLDYESLKDTHPKLLYAHFTAWGRDGPQAEDLGYDVAAFNAAFGMMKYMASPGDSAMPRYPTGFGDMIASVGLAGAVLMGVLERDWTGKGQLLEAGLLRTAAWCMSSVLLDTKNGIKDNALATLDAIAPAWSWGNKSFKTRDCKILIFSCLDARELPRALKVLGAPSGTMVAQAVAQRDLQDILGHMRNAGIEWVSEAAALEDSLFSDTANGLLMEVPGVDDFDGIIREPVTFEAFVPKLTRRSPPLGQHNEEIMGRFKSEHLDIEEVQSSSCASETESSQCSEAGTSNAVQAPSFKDGPVPTHASNTGQVITKFSSVRVVEFGDSVAAAAGSRLLADIGMEVIKVEGPQGDPVRQLSNPAIYSHLNRRKKVLALDTATSQGRGQLLQLVAQADIFLVSRPRQELQDMGLDWESLRKQFPKLIFLHVSPFGYGAQGWHGLGAEFAAFFATGVGLLDTVRPNARVPMEEDTSPLPQLIPFFGEHAASYHVVVGAAGALLHRRNAQVGQKVEVSLENTALWSFCFGRNTISYQQIVNGVDPVKNLQDRFPYKYVGVDKNALRSAGGIIIPGLQAYRCADERWVQLLELQLFDPLSKIHDSLDKDGTSATKRSAAWAAISTWGSIIERVVSFTLVWKEAFWDRISKLPQSEVCDLFDKAGVRYIRVEDTKTVTQNPQVCHLRLVQDGFVRSPIVLHGGASS